MKKKDIVLILILLLLAGCSYLFLQFSSHKGTQVVVTVNKKVVLSEKLSVDKEITVPNTNGKNIIIIKNDKVSMKEADCPDQICVKHKAISKSGESIVCLPHKLVVEILSEGDNEVDIMTQ